MTTPTQTKPQPARKTTTRKPPAKTGNPPADRAARTKTAPKPTPAKTSPKPPASKAAPKPPGTHSYVLRNGDFRVHAAGCKTMGTDLKNSDYDAPAWFSPASQEAAVRELWQDQIRESYTGDGEAPVPFLYQNGYVGATKFHWSCCEGLEKIKRPAGTTGPSASQVAKRELATRVVEAAAAMVAALPDDHTLVLAVGGREAARQTVTNWIHHLPADRERWTAVLPRPSRSDWK